jgi:2-oxoisovalerate dehydrogenase E1 component
VINYASRTLESLLGLPGDPLAQARSYYYGVVDQIFSSRDTLPRPELAGLSVYDLLASYAVMRMSRALDEMETLLHRSGKLWFSIAGAGKEALGTATAWHLRQDDIKVPYYRDRALALWSGITPRALLQQGTASALDPMSGGRQMTSHFGSVEFNFPTGSTMTGSQCLPAAGRAAALLLEQRLGVRVSSAQPDTIVYTSLGDGTTSEGEVEEAIRDAVRNMAPLLIVVEDDGWAISTPVESNIPGGSVSRLYRQYDHIGPNNHLEIMEIDATDFVETFKAFEQATAYLRARKGPVLIHAHVTRPLSHSSADTQSNYRQTEDLKAEQARDPLTRMAGLLSQYGISAEDLGKLDALIKTEVRTTSNDVENEPRISAETVLHHVTATSLHLRVTRFTDPKHTPSTAPPDAELIPMRDMINRALMEAMENDPRIIMFGQDIADYPQKGAPTTGLKGKGGVFHVTRGIGARFPERVWNSPLAEATILGTAMGYALGGFLPVVEVQFRDYIHPGWQQLVDEIATQRWRSNGTFACPMVIRVAYGDYLGGAGAIWHSEAGVGPIAHYPGLRVVVPSDGASAVGLMREALDSGDPVVFLECKSLYENKFARSAWPGPDYRVPLGLARTIQQGDDLTIVTYGNVAPRCVAAAERLEAEHGITCEIIDLRTVDAGYDRTTILKSLKNTRRILVADEDRPIGGFGASVVADIASNWWHHLDAPVGRITPLFTRVSYGPEGEKAIMPTPDKIYDEAMRILRY